jgi:recombination protein RecA
MSLAEQIAAVIKSVEKQFGKGTLMSMAAGVNERVKTFPSGSMGLDMALGTGGVPRGRVIEVFGPESSGKTTLALHMIAEAQKAGLITAFIDAEHALDIRYASKLGVNVEEMLISQPDYGEQALDIAAALAGMGGIGFIVVDSVAALTPKAEIEGEMGDHHVGLQARLMSQAMRKLTAVSAKAGTTILFINQIRNKIGVMFGSPETTTGGNALKFYSSVRIEIRRLATLKSGETATGNRVRIRVVKNKLAPPFQEVETDIVFGKGFDALGELLDMGTRLGLVSKSGAWFSYGEERIGQGKEAALAYLEENPTTRAALEAAVRQVMEPAA